MKWRAFCSWSINNGKSPKDLMKPQDGQDIAEKIKLDGLKISSTIGLIEENNAQIAQVHSLTSRDSPISNISDDFNVHAASSISKKSGRSLSIHFNIFLEISV